MTPSGGAIPEEVEPAEEPARRRASAADALAHAVERDDGAVGAAFHEARPAPAECADHLGWRADVEGPLAELEHHPEAGVDGPSAGVGDEPVPVERSTTALKIQGHVVEPPQACQAARHDEQPEPVGTLDQRAIDERVALEMDAEVRQLVLGRHRRQARGQPRDRPRLLPDLGEVEHVGQVVLEQPPVQLDGNRAVTVANVHEVELAGRPFGPERTTEAPETHRLEQRSDARDVTLV